MGAGCIDSASSESLWGWFPSLRMRCRWRDWSGSRVSALSQQSDSTRSRTSPGQANLRISSAALLGQIRAQRHGRRQNRVEMGSFPFLVWVPGSEGP